MKMKNRVIDRLIAGLLLVSMIIGMGAVALAEPVDPDSGEAVSEVVVEETGDQQEGEGEVENGEGDGEGDGDGAEVDRGGETGADTEHSDTLRSILGEDYSTFTYESLTTGQKAEILNRLGLLLGDLDIGLMLDRNVRRSDAAVFFVRLLGMEQQVINGKDTDYAVTEFPDVTRGQWFTHYVAYCVEIGIIAGRTDGYYYPNDSISEKEFTNVLLKILGYIYEEDYDWNTVYEFAYDIGLYNDITYATKTEDNKNYMRSDVCNLIFVALAIEKKDSPQILADFLVERGAIPAGLAIELGLSISSTYAGGGSGTPNDKDVDDYADIEAVYHLEKDVLWVIFTKGVVIYDDNIEITQTYDFSKILDFEVVDATPRDIVLQTTRQIADMEYTIDFFNVIESDGTNAGMLSFDFLGFDEAAGPDTETGPTTKVRDEENGGVLGGGSGAGQGDGTGGEGGSGGNGQAAGSETNADPMVEYFRVVNAYSTGSNQIAIVFSQPLAEGALSGVYYDIYQSGAGAGGDVLIGGGQSGQHKVEFLENSNNAVKITSTGIRYQSGTRYRVSVSGDLVSNYTARLNKGQEDSFSFVANNVTEMASSFTVKNIKTYSQYLIEIEFSQPVDASTASMIYNYYLADNSGARVDISSVSVVNDTGGGGGGQTLVRINTQLPMNTQRVYQLTIVFMKNQAETDSLANHTISFDYSTLSANRVSSMTLTGVAQTDASTIEVFFDRELDKASATIASNYSVSSNDDKAFSATPVAVYYEPAISPYKVRLYFSADKRFIRDYSYRLRVLQSIRESNMTSPSKMLEMGFFSTKNDSPNPAIRDAVIIADDLIRINFTKEIAFSQKNISESNFLLETVVGSASSAGVAPSLVKYADAQNIILRFNNLDLSREYRVRFNSITDFSGLFTSNYPDTGTTSIVRQGQSR